MIQGEIPYLIYGGNVTLIAIIRGRSQHRFSLTIASLGTLLVFGFALLAVL
jgi:hypothetical protein